MAAKEIRAFAQEILQRPEFASMDAATKDIVVQKLVRVADPTDPRNLLTALLLNFALIRESHASPRPPTPATVREPLSAIAATPEFRTFAESITGPAGILAAPGGLETARAELSAAVATVRTGLAEAVILPL